MEVLALFSVPLLFTTLIYILVYKKDEKYLQALADRARAQQIELRRLQIQMNSIHNKLHVVEQFCHSLRPKYESVDRWKFLDEDTKPGVKISSLKAASEPSLKKLEKEITSIKEILNLAESGPF